MPASKRHIAVFITPHGYGHAARATASLLSLRTVVPNLHFEVFTRVPQWFFNVTLQHGFTYHELYTDVGLVQDSVMEENLGETVARLQQMTPYRPAAMRQLAQQMQELNCELVLCDIAPMGIAAAQAAGLPSILIENFTWDWIYEGYLVEEPRLGPSIDYLQQVFASADAHIRTEPACSDHLPADLITNVVGRKPRTSCQQIRKQLGVSTAARIILVTMGGIGSQYPFLEKLQTFRDVTFLIPGGGEELELRANLVLLPHHSDFYHPDLVEAADAVIGKLGYSTLAESYHAGLPFAYIPRPRFRESPAMSGFVLDHMHGIEVPEEKFYAGEWFDVVPRLLEIPRARPSEPNGADQIAEFIRERYLS